ncbi:MAG TPA: sensor histidine kinase [Candidatus Hypogeohydataceae bacterium YC41]
MRPERFNLLFYYTLTSFIVISVVCVAVGLVFARLEKEDLVNRSLRYFKYMSANLNRAIYEEVFFPSISKGELIDFEKNKEQVKKLDDVIKKQTFGYNLQKLYIFDMNGKIIYSTIPEHIGFAEERGKNSALDEALEGGHTGRLREPGELDDKGVKVEDAPLLESYYPLYEYKKGDTQPGTQVGVIEIYQDMRDLRKQIHKAEEKAIITAASATGVLFGLLFLVVLRAAKVINIRTRELQEARTDLERKVVERTREIEKAQQALNQSEKMASLGRLIAGIAHEINNPLACIGGCAEALLYRLGNLGVQNGKLKDFPEYLKVIQEETYRCKNIISGLLNFSRQVEPALEPTEIQGLIREVSSTVTRQVEAERRPVRIELLLPNEALYVSGDSQQLRQVFLNLFINSLDAIEGEGKITVRAQRQAQDITILFQDTGCGIRNEDLQKVFDPFFTTKPPGKGTGLGLSICYSIIQAHRGTVEALSDGPARGATFKLSLPLLMEVSEREQLDSHSEGVKSA